MNSKSIALPVFLLVSAAVPVFGQVASDENPNQTMNMKAGSWDKQAAGGVKAGMKQFLSPKPGYGMPRVQRELALKSASGSGSAAHDSVPGVPSPGFYPGDVSYDSQQGAVITDLVGHPIYVNTDPGTVGYPGTLLRDLGKSDLIHVIDQYVGRTDDNRYKAGVGGLLTYSIPASTPLYDGTDIATIVHAAAVAFGSSGYHVAYHVYLAPGQDVCFDATSGVCYSPDNPATFGFCAYHSSFVFSDVGEVIYSVQPYQAVQGCEVGLPSPNGLVMDSAMSVLSHELSELITDPDGYSWWNHYSLDLYGAEIADICQNATFRYASAKLNGRYYELQPQYSNHYHACSYVP